MPGSIYQKNLRLARAYSEGLEGNPVANPHPAGSPAAAAYAAGALQDCSTYAGPAGCTGAPVGRSGVAAQPVSAGAVMASWTKQQLKDWLFDHEIDYPSDASKAELQKLAGIG